MYYLHHEAIARRRMRNAVFSALGLHLVLISVISFNSTSSENYQRQIEVTLATVPSDSAPEEARHIAAAAQQGSGEEAQEDAVTTANNLPMQAAVDQQIQPRASSQQQEAGGDMLSTVAAAEQVTSDQDEADAPNFTDGQADNAPRPQQMAAMQAEIDNTTRADAHNPRVRRLTAVSARQAADAAYLLEWRRRLENVGNRYYPEASVRYGLYGDLRLLVVVRKDGHLEDVRVLESSGYAVLDEAALKIVRMAAPFPPFPAELAATTDKLEIVRTWQFQENQLGSN